MKDSKYILSVCQSFIERRGMFFRLGCWDIWVDMPNGLNLRLGCSSGTFISLSAISLHIATWRDSPWTLWLWFEPSASIQLPLFQPLYHLPHHQFFYENDLTAHLGLDSICQPVTTLTLVTRNLPFELLHLRRVSLRFPGRCFYRTGIRRRMSVLLSVWVLRRMCTRDWRD